MINIRISTLGEIYTATLQVPEFQPHYSLEKFRQRLSAPNPIILGAFDGQQIAGFKVGYELSQGVFYSWVGAVLPSFRRKGIALALAKKQEEILREQGYQILRMKTRNKFRNMLLFALNNGFQISGFEEHPSPEENRIWLEKRL